MDTYVPYLEKKKAGSVTPEDTELFNKQYLEHIEKQESYMRQIRSITEADKDIGENRFFKNNSSGLTNWTGERFCQTIEERLSFAKEAYGRGWPAEDVPVLREFSVMQNTLKDIMNNKGGKISREHQQEAKKLLGALKEPYDRVQTSYIASAEERKQVLGGMEKSVKDFLSLQQQVYPPNDVETRKQMPGALERSFKEAGSRKVNDFEVGREPEQLSKGFSLQEIGTNIKYLVEDLKAVEMTFGGSKEFKEMKESLLNLQRSAETNLKRGVDDPQALKTLQAKMTRTMQDTQRYLDHKERQFAEDANRRDSASKQKREQPRIRMALNMMDKLQFLAERTQAAEKVVNPETAYMEKKLPKVKEAQKAKLQEKINAESEPLKEAKDKSEYLKHVCKVMTYYERTKDSFYKRQTGNMEESFESFQKRVENVGSREFSGKELKEIGQRNGLINKILNEENARWKESGGLSADQRLSVEDIKKRVDAEIRKEAERKHEKKEPEKQQQKQRERQTARYRQALVSKPREAQGPAVPQ